MFRHKIPLAETDAFRAPVSERAVLVQCDGCGEEQTYEASEIVRLEFNVPGGFAPTPDASERVKDRFSR